MDFLQQNYLTVILALVSLSGFIFFSLKKPPQNVIPAAQATLLINRENAVIIDVRSSNEYVAGHLPESHNIDLMNFEERQADLKKWHTKPIILVCQSGKRALTALAKLEKEGFPRVYCLDGGISAWIADGMPIKKGAKK